MTQSLSSDSHHRHRGGGNANGGHHTNNNNNNNNTKTPSSHKQHPRKKRKRNPANDVIVSTTTKAKKRHHSHVEGRKLDTADADDATPENARQHDGNAMNQSSTKSSATMSLFDSSSSSSSSLPSVSNHLDAISHGGNGKHQGHGRQRQEQQDASTSSKKKNRKITTTTTTSAKVTSASVASTASSSSSSSSSNNNTSTPIPLLQVRLTNFSIHHHPKKKLFPSFRNQNQNCMQRCYISIYGRMLLSGGEKHADDSGRQGADDSTTTNATNLPSQLPSQKACIHLHGIFPYFYIEKPSHLTMNKLAEAIENQLACNCVHNITEHQKVPFYGFYTQQLPFWKIEFGSVWQKKKAAEWIGRHFKMQVYEAHFPFLLQVFMDYDLTGCGWLKAKKWTQRIGAEKMSSVSFEADVHIDDVLNREKNDARWRRILASAEGRSASSPLVSLSNSVSNQHVKLVNSLAQIWNEEKKRRRANNLSSQFTQAQPSQRSATQKFKYQELLQQKIDQMIGHLDIQLSSQRMSPPQDATTTENVPTTTENGEKNEYFCSTQEDLDWMDQHVEYENQLYENEDQDEEQDLFFEDTEANPMEHEEMGDILTATQELSSFMEDEMEVDDSNASVKANNAATPFRAPQSRGTTSRKNRSTASRSSFIPQLDGAFDDSTIPADAPSPRAPPKDHRVTQQREPPLLKSILRTSSHYNQPRSNHHSGKGVSFDTAPPKTTVYYNIGDKIMSGDSRISIVTAVTVAGGSDRNLLEVFDFVPLSAGSRELVLVHETRHLHCKDITSPCIIVPRAHFHSVSHHPYSFHCDYFSKSAYTLSVRYPLHSDLKHLVHPSKDSVSNIPSKKRILIGSYLGSLKRSSICFNKKPPTWDEVVDDLHPHVIYNEPQYSSESNHESKRGTISGSTTSTTTTTNTSTTAPSSHVKPSTLYRFATPPPTFSQISSELSSQQQKKSTSKIRVDQRGRLILPTNPQSTTSKPLSVSMTRESAEDHDISCLTIELLIKTRGSLSPDPEYDPVEAIFYTYQEEKSGTVFQRTGSIILQKYHQHLPPVNSTHLCQSELEIFRQFISMVQHFDPDILLGYEVQKLSLGYLIDRNRVLKQEPLEMQISRRKFIPFVGSRKQSRDEWGIRKQSGINIIGRTVLNVWRLLRSALKLRIYNIQNCAFHCLKKQYPKMSWETLTSYCADPNSRTVRSALWHIFSRCLLTFKLLDHLDIIRQTSEMAQIYGIEFFAVHNRGSQYRVESVMCRIAKPLNYVIVSPSRRQVATADAMECVPLVMEPRSQFYKNPVVVLDFQSLYPSLIIAYNLCFSTCLGKIVNKQKKRLGAISNYSIPPSFVEHIKDDVFVTPNAAMFVKKNVREGILPRMLHEILQTRIMVKKAMKSCQESDPVMYRVLNARQFGLKMIANVTYGYTAASFSGRMPLSCLADAIVQLGRETLEKTIETIHELAPHRWMNARVVYGDTDSVFVEIPGASKEDAFRIGREIAAYITKQNPQPMRLQFEKVYHPCILVTKKRYVGYSYESETQKEPHFDAKGVECVRRDNCPMVAKMMEKSLRILFNSSNLSLVKRYVVNQWAKLLRGQYSLKDYIFSKEVKLGSYRGPTLPPGAIVAHQKMKLDPRSEPLYKERVPYVVVFSDPHARLVDMVCDPWQLICQHNTGFIIHAYYYISKQMIPALNRLFSLVEYSDTDGTKKTVDVLQWFEEMPKYQKSYWFLSSNTLDSYFVRSRCLICKRPSHDKLCANCVAKYGKGQCVAQLVMHQTTLEKQGASLEKICMNCIGTRLHYATKCHNLVCEVMYQREKNDREKQEAKANIDSVQ